MKTVIAAPCAIALAAVTAACGTVTGSGALPAVFTPDPHASAIPSTIDWPTDAQLRAYIKAHLVPALPGMTVAIASYNGYVTDKELRCPPGHGSRGFPGTCEAWRQVLITATGTLKVTCGSMTADIACPSAVYPADGADPWPIGGDYVYAPSNGQVTADHDLRIISRDVIS